MMVGGWMGGWSVLAVSFAPVSDQCSLDRDVGSLWSFVIVGAECNVRHAVRSTVVPFQWYRVLRPTECKQWDHGAATTPTTLDDCDNEP